MDKWQAINAFWNGFGIPAYDENTVPVGASMPYITYEAKVSDFENPISLSASVWYYSNSLKDISNKVDEIYRRIHPWLAVPIDGGYMYMYPGVPFAQRMQEPGNDAVKRVYLIMEVEFMTI